MKIVSILFIGLLAINALGQGNFFDTFSEPQKIVGKNKSEQKVAFAVSGDTLAVGINSLNYVPGAVQIYAKSGGKWIHQAKLTAKDAGNTDLLGGSVAISGDTIVAGANSKDGTVEVQGAAYVFKRTGTKWTQEAKLVHANPNRADYFGGRVAIAGDTVVVSATGRDDSAGNDSQGAAYVFVRNGNLWKQKQMLTGNDSDRGDEFGRSVAINRNTIVIGAPEADWDEKNKTANGLSVEYGAVYVFDLNGGNWTQTTRLVSSEPTEDEDFGSSVAIGDDNIFVGAPKDMYGKKEYGSVQQFVLSFIGWFSWRRVQPANKFLGDKLGM